MSEFPTSTHLAVSSPGSMHGSLNGNNYAASIAYKYCHQLGCLHRHNLFFYYLIRPCFYDLSLQCQTFIFFFKSASANSLGAEQFCLFSRNGPPARHHLPVRAGGHPESAEAHRHRTHRRPGLVSTGNAARSGLNDTSP